ncbi:MAG TPA: hypothetical protein VKK81_03885 [Candidatus Binatia bacterium]|nr:hypothetical protein [Candidatus Binatia bacterium]
MGQSPIKSLRSTFLAVLPFDALWLYRQRRGKRRLIDFACERLQIRSFADLGGVWGVDGEYTFYAMETHRIETAFLVDISSTETLTERKKRYPGLKIISGNFGEDGVARQIGRVDAVLLFDVLLHQVNPDWDEILDLYASRTKCFLIFNPQYFASKSTVRLLDLGEEEYFRNIPHTKDEEPYKTVFEKMYEIHPRPQYQQRRIYRDIHDIWQWGIVDDDLTAKMKSLGFSLQYFRNHGKFNNLANFENHAFAFSKR